VELAKHCRLTVITADRFGSRNNIIRALEADPALAAHTNFHFLADFTPKLQTPRMHVVWKYFQPIYYVHYRRWMMEACDLAQNLVRSTHFDLAHQLTMIGYREPGYLWTLPIPFVWGPIGGTQNVPWAFLPSLGPVECLRHGCRNIVNFVQLRTHKRVRQALSKAGGLIAATRDTRAALRRVHGCESIVIPASFAPSHFATRALQATDSTKPLRLVFSGMHASRKGLPYVLAALGHLRRDGVSVVLDVVGEGHLTTRWRAQAEGADLNEMIVWHGQLPRKEAVAVMARADLMVFPSLLEGSPMVVAEALALGLPVITTAHHGMADFVDDTCGLLIRPSSPRQLAADIASAICFFDRHRNVLHERSQGAIRRARQLSSESLIPEVVRLYSQVLAGESAK
jgi:glycosyltransferase involved in cell wall biosynthesis